jgi:macrolide-specific efflux system membrane fusion protein
MYSQDATSRAELETALANFKTAQAQIAAINAQIEQSRLTLATAKKTSVIPVLLHLWMELSWQS